MKINRKFSIVALAATLLLLPTVPSLLAQDNDQDPPTRAGRIGFVQGSVSFQPGGDGDWLEAVPNRPLTTGDNLWVDKGSRAEVQIGSTSIRLGPETSLTFLDLGDDVTQVRLSTGSIYFRVLRFDGNDRFEVDSPNLAFNVDQAGEFRLDVNPNGDQTVATVWRGRSEITGGSGDSYRLQAGQQGAFSGTDQLSYDVGEIGQPDDFGQWAMSRDQREDRAPSRQYVSEDMTGYEDLDDYGRWHEVAGYGNVWTPSGVPGDWAPYRYGNWTYISPWGWTWVEQEPWGFAPFHYGRWASVQGSWCWIPGPVAVRPVYSPALVAFVGGGGFSIGVGVGGGVGVGWFPLGPGEVFVPWYRTSPRYVQNVNVTNTRVNVTQVTNVYNNVTVNHVTNVTYVNQRVTNSVTVVNHDTFVNARPVHNNIVRVDARQMAAAPVTHDVARNIQPDRQSVVGPARQVQNRPPEQAVNRQVVATRQPTVVNRPAAVMGAGNQRPAAPPAVRTVRAAPQTEAKSLERGARGGANPPPNNNVGARPGQPGNQPGAPANRPGADNNRSVPGQPSAPGNQPGAPANRPGADNNNRNTPGAAGEPGNQPGAPANRPGADNNRNTPGAVGQPGNQPGAPANRPGADNNRNTPGAVGQPGNQPGAPANRPGASENNRPGADNNRNVPRPGGPDNNRPGSPDNRPAAPENNRPGADNNPNAGQPDNRPAAPVNRPGADNNRNVPRPGGPDNSHPAAPENRPAQPENNRPSESVPRPPSANRPDQTPEQPRQNPGARPDSSRPETPRAQPEQSSRPPQTRQDNAPPQNRPDVAPRNQNQPAPAPRTNTRTEPAPRPEARPAQPQRTEAPAKPPKEEKPPKEDKGKDKPQTFR